MLPPVNGVGARGGEFAGAAVFRTSHVYGPANAGVVVAVYVATAVGAPSVQSVDAGPETMTLHGVHGSITKVTLSLSVGSSQSIDCRTLTLTLYVAASGKTSEKVDVPAAHGWSTTPVVMFVTFHSNTPAGHPDGKRAVENCTGTEPPGAAHGSGCVSIESVTSSQHGVSQVSGSVMVFVSDAGNPSTQDALTVTVSPQPQWALFW